MAFNDPNYKGPVSDSNYLNFQEVGKHQFRFMSNVETYKRYWLKNKPYRYETPDQIPYDVDLNKSGKKNIQQVWSVIAIKRVNGSNQIGILSITQKTIQRALMSLFEDKDYGDFINYDVVIDKLKGEKTEYTVTPKPPKSLTDEELKLYEAFPLKDLSKQDSHEDPNRLAVIEEKQEEFSFDDDEAINPEEVTI